MAAMLLRSYFLLTVLLLTEGAHGKDEKRLVLDGETDVVTQMAQLEQQILALQNALQTEVNKSAQTKHELDAIKGLVQGSGSVYVRWGRNTCPTTASLVYKGFTGGKHHRSGGSGTDTLCLPSDPTWSKYLDGNQYLRGRIYGTEIDTEDSSHIFDYPVNEQDMPCAVCQSNRSSILMIPARNNCYGGWSMEYHGYLMAGGDPWDAYNHICMDGEPEFLQHGATDDNQHILYLVEGQCGSLPCPPYVAGRELACVVCSK